MGFIREPEGVDFVITSSPTIKEDIAFISSCVQQHKEQAKVDKNINAKRDTKHNHRISHLTEHLIK